MLQSPCEFSQDIVASVVAEVIVDLFEMVAIAEHHHGLRAIRCGISGKRRSCPSGRGRSLQRSQVLAGQRILGILQARSAVLTIDRKQLAEKCLVIVEPLQQFVDVPLRVE